MTLKPTDKSLLFSKNDPDDRRMGDIAKLGTIEDVSKNSFSILGYPDDRGIKLNDGRPGASEGPDSIRQIFYKMTPSFFSKGSVEIWDIGNTFEETIEAAHQSAQKTVEDVMKRGSYAITLGGGHDYGYADGAALIKNSDNPLIINFDAHLDVRPDKKGPNSGTPFYRLINNFEKLDLLQIGVQSQCNSPEHFKWAESKGVKVLSWDEINYSGEDSAIVMLKFLEPYLLKARDTFISVDIDGFSANYAMGCSQSWPTGLEPNSFFRVFRVLCDRLNVKVLGIYEVSPPLDSDQKTAKLAAQIIHKRIFR